MSAPLIKMNWKRTKHELMKADGDFTVEKDLVAVPGDSGHKARFLVRELMEADGFKPEISDSSKLVIKAESLKRWRRAPFDHFQLERFLKVRHTFLEGYGDQVSNRSFGHSTENHLRIPNPRRIPSGLNMKQTFRGTIRSDNEGYVFIECDEILVACDKYVRMHSKKLADSGCKVGDRVEFRLYEDIETGNLW